MGRVEQAATAKAMPAAHRAFEKFLRVVMGASLCPAVAAAGRCRRFSFDHLIINSGDGI